MPKRSELGQCTGTWLFIGALILGLAGATHAQTDDASEDHEALRELQRAYERAVAENDPSLLRDHLAADFSAVMVTGQEVTSYQELVSYWEEIRGMIGEGGTYSVEVNVAELASIFGDTAVAHGTTDDVVVTGDGQRFEFSSKWTAVCRKVDGQWQVLRMQGSMNPLENPFIAAKVGAVARTTGLGAGAVGLLLGWFGHLLYRRRAGKKREAQEG